MQNIIKLLLCCVPFITSAQSLVWSGKCHASQRETYGVAFSPNGQFVVSGSECHPASIRLWNASNGSLIWDYNVGNTLMCQMGVKMSQSGNFICSMEEAGNLIVLQNNGTSPTLLYTLNLGTGGSHSVDISPDEQHVAVDGNNDKVKIYKLSDGTLTKTLSGHTGDVICVRYSQDGSKLISGSTDNTAKLWDTSGALLHTFTGLSSKVVTARFFANDTKIALATRNGKVVIYDVQTKSQLTTFNSPEKINQIGISADGAWVVAGCDTSARLFKTATGNCDATFNLPNGGKVYSVDFSPTGSRVVIGNSNGDVAVYDFGTITDLPLTSGYDKAYSVYPNPAQNIVWVSGIESETGYELSDLNGRLVTEGKLTEYQNMITLDQLPRGAYMLKFVRPNSMIVKPLIISY